MLTLVEKILFTLLALASAYAAFQSADRIRRILQRGRDGSMLTRDFLFTQVPRRAWDAALKFITLSPTWRVRPGPTFLHALIAWGFTYYLLVNIGDGWQGFFSGFVDIIKIIESRLEKNPDIFG